MRITSSLDLISLNDAPKANPRLMLRDQGLEIRFESMENLLTYRHMHVERHATDFEHGLDNPTDELGGDCN